MNFFKQAIKFFEYIPKENYEFSIDPTSNNIPDEPEDSKTIFPSLSVNLDYIKTKYNTLINSDIVIREFKIPIRNIDYSAFILFVDGMVDNDSINDFILEPLLLKNSISMKPKESTTTAISKGISVIRVSYNLSPVKIENRLLSELHNRYNTGNHTAKVVRLWYNLILYENIS